MEQERRARIEEGHPDEGLDQTDDSRIAQAETPPEPAQSQPAPAPQGPVVEVPLPAPNQTITVDPESAGIVRFAFDANAATVVSEGNDLVLQINGGEVVIRDYFAERAHATLPTFIDLPGTEVDLGDLLAQSTAGGPQAGTPPPVVANEGHILAPGPTPAFPLGLTPAGPLGPSQLSYGTTEPRQSLFPVKEAAGTDNGVPVATPDSVDAVTNTINLVIVFDRSGSMDEDPNAPGFSTRIDLARAAVASMLAAYESVASVNILIVDFAADANNSGWLDSGAGANAYLAGLDAEGGTNYTGAILEVMSSYDGGLPDARQTQVYFLSDGKPNPTSTSLQESGTIDDWEAFLADKGIDNAFAIGIGPDVNDADIDLQDLAFPNGNGGNVIVVSNISDTFDALVSTVVAAAGNVLTDAPPDQFGPDGPGSPPIVSLVVDVQGVGLTTFTFDGAQIDNDGGLPVQSGSTLTVITALGGELTFDFSDGDYAYDVAGPGAGGQEEFTYTIVDSDGDPSSATLTIRLDDLNVVEPNRVFGTVGNDSGLAGTAETDVVGGGDGDDAIDAGDGNDHISAGAGADTVMGGAGDDIVVGGNQGEVTNAPGNVRPGGADLGDIIDGGTGSDVIFGNEGSDTVTTGAGADTIDGGPGNDTIRYDSPLDAGDVIQNFDASPAGGQDVIDLDGLFNGLGVANADRAGRVQFEASGVDAHLNVDIDGDDSNGAEVTVLTFQNASPASFTAGTAPTDDVQVGTA